MSRWLVLLFALVGCGSSVPLYTRHTLQKQAYLDTPVWIDQNLSPLARQAIAQGLSDWNLALNGHRHYTFKGYINPANSDDIAAFVSSDYSSLAFLSKSYKDQENSVLGYVNSANESVIYLIDDLPSMDLQHEHHVVIHEMGHTLGLEHMSNSLMAPNSDGSKDCIDKKTLMVLAALQDWPLETLNWCDQ